MTRRQRQQYEILVRVRTYGDTHRSQFPEGSAGSQAFAGVTAAVSDCDIATASVQSAKHSGLPSFEREKFRKFVTLQLREMLREIFAFLSHE